ncbi:MAG: glutamine synthetase [Acidimicrobiales bacterium]|nr:glutamine synthetase [Acidimicrobiales bacterium]
MLKRNLGVAREKGFNFYVAPEMEYFYFEQDPDIGVGDRAELRGRRIPRPLDEGSYFDLTTADVANDLRKKTIHMLEALGIPVEYSFHEDSPSQHEIDLRYTDALSMADNVMAFRLVVREIAQQAGVHATFMPKPLEGVQGSGMHTHLSLFEGDANAFHDPGDPYQLSKVGRAFMAGVLHHAREITAVTNQLVNSYKRLIQGTGIGSQTQFEAPVHVSWGRNNRSALVRVPVTKPGKSTSTRLEYRASDPACNPYLAFSVLLAAGLKGIEQGYELPPEAETNVWEMTPAQRAAEGIEPLPASLGDALAEMENSELVAETLGEHIFEWFLRNKRAEWDLYRAQVTPFEVARYLTSW